MGDHGGDEGRNIEGEREGEKGEQGMVGGEAGRDFFRWGVRDRWKVRRSTGGKEVSNGK